MGNQFELSIAAKELSRAGSSKGGKARASKLSPEERKAIARHAVQARWAKAKAIAQDTNQSTPSDGVIETDVASIDVAKLPEAKYRGRLNIVGKEIPCYVLSDGQRVIGRNSATEVLAGIKGSGDFESYIRGAHLKTFLNKNSIAERMVSFRLPDVDQLQKHVKGLPASLFLEVCVAYVSALNESNHPNTNVKLTDRQREIAINAGMFAAACAKVGLDALIDEATGYQYDRARDALEVKLHAYLEDEMRKWEKTFPDELWIEFGRLTGWKGSVLQRPKYWGKLVMELVYEYLDHDVAQWLKENAPKPRGGQSYHLWLTSQYGLRKLVEHIWKLIGIAQTCHNMSELKDKMAELYGRTPVQYRMYLPLPKE